MIKNLKELRQLIKRYKSITLEEVSKTSKDLSFYRVAARVTGFGTFKCLLCKSVDSKCSKCVMGQEETLGCVDHNYKKISEVHSSKELVKFYHNRAAYLEMKYKHLLC